MMSEDRPHRLSFPYENRKFTEMIASFASSGVPDLTKLKAAKLVYFADRAHLLRFGRPIVGGHYYCMDKGPVPSEALDTINAVDRGTKSSDIAAFVDEFVKKIELRRRGWQIYQRLVATTPPDNDAFSESELQVITEIANTLGPLDVGKLIDLSHEHEAWLRADAERMPTGRAEMSYERFFENQNDANVLAMAQAEQEDRDFAAAFRRATDRRAAADR